MRKILAIIVSLITLFAIKEGFHILNSTDKDIVNQRSILIVIALSIIIPLILLSVWLWSSRKNRSQN
ncbi:hypothetical protein GM921_08595 [Pedobacter sp. LMG 31464]|uniref:Uncharacterized protein n=1 Tax=Pedobacter planticolens TaxID=2679964 RepID=A0A923E0X3_9SPHI|nr:hypothetical protein [Pedobacter planticolens]MBB2145539.1 hypothetical protein [Pedobacter planticolens]